MKSLILFVCAGLLTSLTALPAAHAKTPVSFAVGLKGGATGTGSAGVPDLTYSQQVKYGRGDHDTGFYPAGGVGAGVGLSLEARAWHVLGLETGFYYMLDNATGWEDKKVNGIDAGRVLMDQETSALHIPLLLKAVANTKTIKPFLGLGFEFVLQQDSSLGYRSEKGDPRVIGIEQFPQLFEKYNQITTSNYTLFQLTTGIEIALGELRIPVEIRAGYHLGWDESFDARVTPKRRSDGAYNFVYDGGYQGQFGIFTGVSYSYDLLL